MRAHTRKNIACSQDHLLHTFCVSVYAEKLPVLCTHDKARVSLRAKVQVAGEAHGLHHSPRLLCLHPHISGVQLHCPVSTGETSKYMYRFSGAPLTEAKQDCSHIVHVCVLFYSGYFTNQDTFAPQIDIIFIALCYSYVE